VLRYLSTSVNFTLRVRQTLKAIVFGRIDLLIDKPIGAPEPFGVGKDIVRRFREKAGPMECREIAKKDFSD
jgi:hypothetical protein